MDDIQEKRDWLAESVGKRYVDCTLETFAATTSEQRKAKAAILEYVTSFPAMFASGTSLALIGPSGTGKDHLLVAALKEIRARAKGASVVYRDGLRLFAQCRESFHGRGESEEWIVAQYTRPHVFAISDPLPPRGPLSDYEQRVMYQILDRRYRECLPVLSTINVSNRKELDDRMGPQAADRLCGGAVVVKCNWASYRTRVT